MCNCCDAKSSTLNNLFSHDLAIQVVEMASIKTGYVYDEDMLKHANPWDSDHIECPDRLRVSHQRCLESGLLDDCERIPSRRAGEEELLLAHSEEHLQNLGSIVQQ